MLLFHDIFSCPGSSIPTLESSITATLEFEVILDTWRRFIIVTSGKFHTLAMFSHIIYMWSSTSWYSRISLVTCCFIPGYCRLFFKYIIGDLLLCSRILSVVFIGHLWLFFQDIVGDLLLYSRILLVIYCCIPGYCWWSVVVFQDIVGDVLLYSKILLVICCCIPGYRWQARLLEDQVVLTSHTLSITFLLCPLFAGIWKYS